MDTPNDQPNWDDKLILIVEDIEANHLLIERNLRKTGVNLMWAMDGESAIDIVNEYDNIDLVLMDIRLPRLDGYSATREIRKIKKSLPIIAQTAYVLPDERLKVLEAGCNDLLTKPYLKEQLISTIQKHFV